MTKLVLSISLVLIVGFAKAQNLISENFDVFPSTWTTTNQSVPVGANTWGQAVLAQSAYFVGGAYDGDFATSYAYVFFQSVAVVGDISNWLITPSIDLQNGDLVSFYTRKGLSGGDNIYADRMEVRISTNGDFTTNPSLGATDVGDFTSLALTINPDLNVVDYPTDWTQYNYIVSGLSSSTSCKIAFRYFVTNGGMQGVNSDYIAIDAFSVERPLATDSFVDLNYTVEPNPANNFITINSNDFEIKNIDIFTIEGRKVYSKSFIEEENSFKINIQDFSKGVFIVSIESKKGEVKTQKFVKN